MLLGKRSILLIFLCLIFIITFFRVQNGIQEPSRKISKLNDKKIVVSKNKSVKIIKHVFIDLGANNGDSIKMFLKTESYSVSETIKGLIVENKTWVIYAVEANPYFNEMLKETKINFENLGHIFYLLSETAASTKNEKVLFYLDPNGKRLGSSLFSVHPDVQSGQIVTVNGIDVSDILKNYSFDDEIVMKVDIEGGEYMLLPHLIKTQAIKLVDRIVVEFHPNVVESIINNTKQVQDSFYNYCRRYNIKHGVWLD